MYFPNHQRITLYEVGELALIVPRFAVLAMCPPSYHITSILYLCTGGTTRMTPPLDNVSGSGGSLQPAFLPQEKARQQFLERGAVLGKFQLDGHIAIAETIGVFQLFQHTGSSLFQR